MDNNLKQRTWLLFCHQYHGASQDGVWKTEKIKMRRKEDKITDTSSLHLHKGISQLKGWKVIVLSTRNVQTLMMQQPSMGAKGS